MGAAHEFEPHVSEVKVRLRADTREELYAQAARALAELLAEPGPDAARDAPADGERTVRVEAHDPSALLAEWINELVYLSETEKRVFRDVTIDELDDRRLVARVRGFVPAGIRTAIKAATYHDLHVGPVPAGSSEPGASGPGWAATMVLDA